MRNFSLLRCSDINDTAGPEEAPGAGKTVLLIDDHEFCSKLSARLLKRAGFRVIEDALSSEKFHAIVCSVEKRASIKSLAKVPVILTTPRRIDDLDESYDDIDADDVSLCGDVVEAVLEALWDPRCR